MYLTAVNLRFAHRGNEPLFDMLSFELRPNSLVALVGPSGSGKSTLLSILAGWEKPTAGSIHRSAITKTAWVFQNPSGSARRSALDHVVLPYLARGRRRPDAESAARQRLADFGLETVALREFRSLSGGEAQRLCLARSVASNPDLLLVDEPTAQLDANNADTVVARLRSLASVHRLVVIATHDGRVIEECDQVLKLSRG